MIHLALLRGINVGGRNKVGMKQLKQTFEGLELNDVQTYINTGNVIFEADINDADGLASDLHEAVWKEFRVRSAVLLRNINEIQALVDALPSTWVNDADTKCDVLFLSDEIDSPDIVEELPAKPDIDEVAYVPGAVIWRVERGDVTRSGLSRVVGSDLYASMTIRNCNTVRKLADLMASRTD